METYLDERLVIININLEWEELKMLFCFQLKELSGNKL